jgi:hypothetical protein
MMTAEDSDVLKWHSDVKAKNPTTSCKLTSALLKERVGHFIFTYSSAGLQN